MFKFNVFSNIGGENTKYLEVELPFIPQIGMFVKTETDAFKVTGLTYNSTTNDFVIYTDEPKFKCSYGQSKTCCD